MGSQAEHAPDAETRRDGYNRTMLKDFKAFVMRGNVLDLAVAVVIGGAFGKIVSSFVDDILMPPIGLLLGPVDFRERFIDLSGQHHATLAQAEAAGAAVLRYGAFINAIVGFLIIAFAIFLVVRGVMHFLPAPPAPDARECPHCLSRIPLRATRCRHCTAEVAPA
jgi:large conductance mechanosensitive channel